MPKFVIEREIPGAGKMSPAELKTISKKSCGVLSNGARRPLDNSYVTADKIYCVYHAADESLYDAMPNWRVPCQQISMVTTLTIRRPPNRNAARILTRAPPIAHDSTLILETS